MVELPEVETIRRDLEKEIVGRRIKDVDIRPGTNAMKVVPRHGRRKELQDLLSGAKVEKIERLGKRLFIDLDNEHVMIFWLGSAGQILKTSGSDEIAPHTHIVISFTIGGQMRFVDPTREAELFVAPRKDLEALEPELKDFLIDPLEHQFTWQYFSQLLQDREISMKELLTDKSFICGLGEIYSDEVLFAAGIRYDKLSNKLTSQDVRRLYRALMETLQDSVKARGTSYGEFEYRDLHGDPGQFQFELKVYGRDGEACRRCRNTIEKGTVAELESYYCPQCQS